MTPVVKIVLALGGLCLAIVLGLSHVHKARADKHYYRLMYAARNEMHEQVVYEYHHLPASHRAMPLVKPYYDDAREKVDDPIWFDMFPTTECADVLSLVAFAIGMCALWMWMFPKQRRLCAHENMGEQLDVPTDGQIAFIRRFNNGIVPVGLTKSAAAVMIENHFAKLSAMSKRQKIDISPAELMTGSSSYREKMRLEREQKRARERLQRQKTQELLKQEREAKKAQKAIDRLYDKRIAEEERLIKAREESKNGIIHKSRNAKMQVVQELQNLVNDILADKKIDPQEVRQLKAWLIANKQTPEDFAQILNIIDDSLKDGIIDANETQAIYEGVIDCLITLRERR